MVASECSGEEVPGTLVEPWSVLNVLSTPPCDGWEEWAPVESRLFPITLKWPVFTVRVTWTTGGRGADGRRWVECVEPVVSRQDMTYINMFLSPKRQ